MATITAKQVNELRTRTGLGMMECKKALVEHDGDIDKAVDYFRKKGVKTSIAERVAGEGRIAAGVSADGARGAIVEINCNTDFTAKSEPIAALGDAAVQKLLADPSADLAADAALSERMVAVAQQTGENVKFGRSTTLDNPGGRVGVYVYTVTNKVAALVAVDGPNVPDDVIADVALHVVATRPTPTRVSRDEVPAETAQPGIERIKAEVAAMGKPPEVAERIAASKLTLFYAEQDVLPDQPFINADKFKGTVGEMLTKAGATLKRFVRVEVGQATPGA